jgi:hypothetical protein
MSLVRFDISRPAPRGQQGVVEAAMQPQDIQRLAV